MNKLLVITAAVFIAVSAQAFRPEMSKVKLSDGEVVDARLCLPDSVDRAIFDTAAKNLW